MSNDLVTVIMPAWNAEKFIAEAIESVIQQTHSNWELIVVDDGSTDNTAGIIRDYTKKDDRIRYISQQHKGQGKARNTALSNAKGEYVAFLDADDLWLPGKLKEQLEIIRTNNVDLVFSEAYVFAEKPGTLKKMNAKPGPYHGIASVKDFLHYNHIPLLTAFTKKSSIQEVNGFSETRDIHEDYDLWLRMLAGGCSFFGIDSPLAFYREQPNSSSSGEGKMLFLDINTLQQFATAYPEHKAGVARAIVCNINDYLAGNNISHWEMANRLIDTRNSLSSNKIAVSFWKGIYTVLGKDVFRVLFNLKRKLSSQRREE